MSRKITIVDGHPDPDPRRLCHALATAYEAGARQTGYEIRRITIAELEFPVLRTRAEYNSAAVSADIVTAQQAIGWAEHIVIIYPLWLGAMPAHLKAFFEQVLRPGFAVEDRAENWPKGLLGGRTARIVVTMGMPAFAYRLFYRAHSLKSLERNILRFCGIRPVGETILGMVDNATEARRTKWLERMQHDGRRAR